jgi:hypothetical protein
LAFGDRPEHVLGFASRLARGRLTKVAKFYLSSEFTNTVAPKLTSRHEGLPALAN